MAANEIHYGDVGTSLQVTVKDGNDVLDVSAASTKQILLLKPGGDLLTKTASFVTDGTDGVIKYVTISGDLDELGMWKIQVYVVIGSSEWHSDVGTFKVFPNIG